MVLTAVLTGAQGSVTGKGTRRGSVGPRRSAFRPRLLAECNVGLRRAAFTVRGGGAVAIRENGPSGSAGAVHCDTEVVTMAASVSYRLDAQLKTRLAQRAEDEGVSETSLVTRLLDEGLKTSAHPGIVYRDGPAGRRAAVAGGPDVWEVVVAMRHTRKRGDARVGSTAEQLGVPERLVRTAVSFAAAHPDEVDTMIARNEAAAERAERAARERERFLAS